MKRLKASAAVKLCYICIVMDLVAAGWKYHLGDKEHTVMMLVGAMMWTACALVWNRTERIENEKHGE